MAADILDDIIVFVVDRDRDRAGQNQIDHLPDRSLDEHVFLQFIDAFGIDAADVERLHKRGDERVSGFGGCGFGIGLRGMHTYACGLLGYKWMKGWRRDSRGLRLSFHKRVPVLAPIFD